MEFSYSQTENFEMEKLSSDTGYFKKPVEINSAVGQSPNQSVSGQSFILAKVSFSHKRTGR